MENLVFGITTMAICCSLYYIAFCAFGKDKYTFCLFLIVFSGFLLRIFTSFDLFLHEWDERYHALVAKNLLENPFKPMLHVNPLIEYNYQDWTTNHIWVHKQPITIYSIAISLLIFGKNAIAVRIPSIIISTLAIISTYKIGELLSTKKIGFLAAFLCSINGLIIELTAGRVATDHVDVLFFGLISFSIYYAIKHTKTDRLKYFLLCGLFTGLAILTKWLPALIVLPVWIVSIIGTKSIPYIIKNTLTLICTILLIVFPWQLYIWTNFPLESAWEFAYNTKHLFEVLEQHNHSIFYHLNRMRIIFGELIYIPLFWMIYETLKQRNVRRNLILLVWIIIPFMFFSFAKTKMQAYTLFTAPAFFILIGLFYQYVKSHKYYKYKLVKFLSLLLFILPVRYCIERVKPFSVIERNHVWIENMKQLDNSIPNERKVVFNCQFPVETMFHTNMVAYEHIPSIEKLKEIHAKEYFIFIDNWKTLMPEKEDLNFVQYVKITELAKSE